LEQLTDIWFWVIFHVDVVERGNRVHNLMKSAGKRKFANATSMDLTVGAFGLIAWKYGNALWAIEILVGVFLRKSPLQTGVLLFS
jgi:hypothetical protein